MEAATPLVTNKDFRQFLKSPKGGIDLTATPINGQSKQDIKNKTSKSKEEKKKKDKSYRDRAKERREGKNLDYARDELLLETLLASKGTSQYVSKDDTLQLGGDLDSTHLVKGLDLNLLRKQKERLEGTINKVEEQEQDEIQEQSEELNFKSPYAKSVHDFFLRQQSNDVKTQFQTKRMAFVYEEDEDGNVEPIPVTLHRSMADCPQMTENLFANIDNNVLENLAKIIQYLTVGPHHGKKEKKRERMELLQQIWDTNKTSQAPLGFQQLKTKGDNTKQNNNDDVTNGNDDEQHLQQAYNGRRKNQVQEPQDKIFDDVDDEAADYRKDLGAKKVQQQQSQQQEKEGGDKRTNLFNDVNDDQDDLTLQNSKQKEQNQQAHGISRRQQMQQKQKQEYEQQKLGKIENDKQLQGIYPSAEEKFSSLKAQNALGAQNKDEVTEDGAGKNSMSNLLNQDAYEECFPDMLGGAWEYDSDDNKDDFTKMDSKMKGQSRYDFQTDEGWQRYKENKEAMPKAAYQFGVKMSDGRRNQKALDGSTRTLVMKKEQKFNKDMRQLETFMNQKFEKDYGKAFAGGIGDEEQGGVQKKKRLNV